MVTKEHKAAYDMAYHARNREKRRAQMRAYMQRNWLERKYGRLYGVGIPEARRMIKREELERRRNERAPTDQAISHQL